MASESYRPCLNPAPELSLLLLPSFQQELKTSDPLGDITPHMLLIEMVVSQNMIYIDLDMLWVNTSQQAQYRRDWMKFYGLTCAGGWTR